jgi:hypothetical protein
MLSYATDGMEWNGMELLTQKVKFCGSQVRQYHSTYKV